MTEQDLLNLINKTFKILNSTVENLSLVATEIASKFEAKESTDYKLNFSQKAKDKAEKQ